MFANVLCVGAFTGLPVVLYKNNREITRIDGYNAFSTQCKTVQYFNHFQGIRVVNHVLLGGCLVSTMVYCHDWIIEHLAAYMKRQDFNVRWLWEFYGETELLEYK